MANTNKINHHVFHEFYSYSYSANANWLVGNAVTRFPIHNFRAMYKNLYTGKEFESELDVYNFQQNTEFSSIPLKNFIVIPESEIYKYYGLLNDMIKSIKINYINAQCKYLQIENYDTSTEKSRFKRQGNASASISCDTSSIFELKETQNRLWTYPITRSLGMIDENKYSDFISFDDSSTIPLSWRRYIQWGSDSANNALAGFQDENIFPFNATAINDPIFYPFYLGKYPVGHSSMCTISVSSPENLSQNGQAVNLNSNKVGSYSINSNQYYIDDVRSLISDYSRHTEEKGSLGFNINTSFGFNPWLYYIKNKKEFILFIEYSLVIEEGNDRWGVPRAIRYDTALFLLMYPNDYEKKSINIKLGDQICQLEVSSYKHQREEISESYPLDGGMAYKYRSREVTANLPEILVEVNSWNKDDFIQDKFETLYPPKVQ